MKEEPERHGKKETLRPKYPTLPEVITCPECGFDMELWNDEYETKCMNCGHRFFRRESTIH